MRTRDEPDDEEALIIPPAHSTLTHVFPSVQHSDIHPETTLSPPAPVCLQKRALLMGSSNITQQMHNWSVTRRAGLILQKVGSSKVLMLMLKICDNFC